MSRYKRGKTRGPIEYYTLYQELTGGLNLLAGWPSMTKRERQDLRTWLQSCMKDFRALVNPRKGTWGDFCRAAMSDSIMRDPDPPHADVKTLLSALMAGDDVA